MTDNEARRALNWDTAFEIAGALAERFPRSDQMKMTDRELRRLIGMLPDTRPPAEDTDPDLLRAVQEAWIEIDGQKEIDGQEEIDDQRQANSH